MNLPGRWPGFTPHVALNRKNPFLTWAFPLPVAVYDWGVNSNPMTPGEMPQDPVSKARQEAIEWFDAMMEFVEAGFTRDEAFELISTKWGYWYQANFSAQAFGGGREPD